MSPNEIRALSAGEVGTNGNADRKCCYHIELAQPMLNIAFIRQTLRVLRSICFHCSLRLPNPGFIPCSLVCNCGLPQPEFSRAGVQIFVCEGNSETIAPMPRANQRCLFGLEIHNVFEKISKDDCSVLGMTRTRPEWMLTTCMPMPLNAGRSSQRLVSDIIRVNSALRQSMQQKGQTYITRQFEQLLQYHLAVYMDGTLPSLHREDFCAVAAGFAVNAGASGSGGAGGSGAIVDSGAVGAVGAGGAGGAGAGSSGVGVGSIGDSGGGEVSVASVPPAALENLDATDCMQQSEHCQQVSEGVQQRASEGAHQRIHRIVQEKLLRGWRVSSCCRLVVTADPCLGIDLVGVSQSVAMRLTYPERVTPFNKDQLARLVENGPKKYPGATCVRCKDGKDEKIVELVTRCSGSCVAQQRRGGSGKEGAGSAIELRLGWVVERHMQDDDYVVLSNQEQACRKSHSMGHRVKIIRSIDNRYAPNRRLTFSKGVQTQQKTGSLSHVEEQAAKDAKQQQAQQEEMCSTRNCACSCRAQGGTQAVGSLRLNPSVIDMYKSIHCREVQELVMHFPRSILARAEVQQLMVLPRMLLNHVPGGTPLQVCDDVKVSMSLLTQRNMFIGRELMMDLVMAMDYCGGSGSRRRSRSFLPIPAILLPIKSGTRSGGGGSYRPLWTGKQVFSLMCPPVTPMQNKTSYCDPWQQALERGAPSDEIVIVDEGGELLCGSIDRENLGLREGLLHRCVLEGGFNDARIFVERMHAVGNCWLGGHNSFSFGIRDMAIPVAESRGRVQQLLDNGDREARNIIEKGYRGELTTIRGETKSQSIEKFVMTVGLDTRNACKGVVYRSLSQCSSLGVMVNASSGRVSFWTASKLLAAVGQTHIEEKRIPPACCMRNSSCGRTLPHFARNDDGPSARGTAVLAFIRILLFLPALLLT
jgi:DNA-directed RNA polymerase beta' subunit